jgi:hypothetical protein
VAKRTTSPGAPAPLGEAPPSSAEEAALRARRATAGLPVPIAGDSKAWLGVGLSGGGIRSATFALGFFQAIARAKLLRHVDLLSTVSGGGYFGAFLGRLFRRPYAPTVEAVEDVLCARDRPNVLHHLREHGRYLAPSGSGDAWTAVATILRGWIAVVAVLGVSILTLFLGLQWLRLGVASVWPAARSTLFGAFGLEPLGGVWWSPWLALPAFVLVFVCVPVGGAYWAADPDRRPKTVYTLFIAALGLVPVLLGESWAAAGIVVTVLALATFLFGPGPDVRSTDDYRGLRSRRTRALAKSLQLATALLAIAIVDTAAGSIYRSTFGGEFWGRLATIGGAVAATMAAYGRRLGAWMETLTGRKGASIPASTLASVAGVVLAAGLVLAVGLAAHGLSAGFGEPADRREGASAAMFRADLFWTTGFLFVGLVLTWLAGLQTPFLNRSSHHAFYSGRLVRAWLGASNPRRWGGKLALRDYDEDDDQDLAGYHRAPATTGAPVHLVNVTINETVDGTSQVQQRDRRGLTLAVGPDGIRVGRVREIRIDWASGRPTSDSKPPPDPSPEVKPAYTVEELTLGQWTALSGAAFSTGLGSRTRLGTSLLCGITNVRLGYWWSPGIPTGETLPRLRDWLRAGRRRAATALARAANAPNARAEPSGPPPRLLTVLRRHFDVQAHLVSELVARFPGTAWPRWYLSDGGHFENLGGYELIRRGLRRILLVDAEADPDFEFEGLSRLVRLARMDFGAEIRFLTDEELDAAVIPAFRPFVGPLARLRRREVEEPDRAGGLPRRSLVRCALAEVRYLDGTTGRLLYVKATVTGDEPADVVGYAVGHPAFPHEPTSDQFFDEAQWESYRRLGEHIGGLLFDVPVTGGARRAGPRTPASRFDPRRFVESEGRAAAEAPTPAPGARATPGTKSA